MNIKRLFLSNLAIAALMLFFANNSIAGGGHAHGRSQFVNGGEALAQTFHAIEDIKSHISIMDSAMKERNLADLKPVADEIYILSDELKDNTHLNKTRYAKMKRALRTISKAANKLRNAVIEENLSEIEKQVTKLLKSASYLK